MGHVKIFLSVALWVLLTHAFRIHEIRNETSQWTFTPAPRDRGTWYILSKSCAALVACTWSVLHLNIPRQTEMRPQEGWKDKAKCIFAECIPTLEWTAAAIVAPEALVGFSFGDWMHARKAESLLRAHGKGNLRDWDRTHIYFANMGGFVFKFKGLARDHNADNEDKDNYDEDIAKTFNSMQDEFAKPGYKFSMELAGQVLGFITYVFQRVMKGLRSLGRGKQATLPESTDHQHASGSSTPIELVPVRSHAESNPRSPHSPENTMDATTSETQGPERSGDQHETESVSVNHTGSADTEGSQSTTESSNAIEGDDIVFFLNGTQILAAQCLGIISQPPELSTENIEDKSKATPFTKVCCLAPLILVVYDVINGSYRDLPVSHLEFAICTYGVCTILASLFYWSKPQAVRVPEETRSRQLRKVTRTDERLLSQFGGTSFIRTNFVPPFGADRDRYFRKVTEIISNDNTVGEFCSVFGTILQNSDFASVISGSIFGGLYCLAWNSIFPTTVERYIWRTASVITTVGLIPYALLNTIFTRMYSKTKSHTDIRQKIGLYSLMCLYILARVILIGQMFRSVFYQPAKTL